MHRPTPFAAALALALAACGQGEPPDEEPQIPAPAVGAQRPAEMPPTARPQLWSDMLASREIAFHPSDGGGRAWLDLPEGEGAVPAGGRGRWPIVYEAGPLGVAEGGSIFLQISPFWGWSSPQSASEEMPGFTAVATEAQGVELEPRALGQELLAVTIRGRALREGERVRFDYGAGPAGARADSYAERGSRFWIAVDGDGDGARKVLADSPGVDVLPREPARLVLTLPSTARPGSEVRATVAVLDAAANAGLAVEGSVEWIDPPEGLELPDEIPLEAGDLGRKTVTARAAAPGLYRLRARATLGEVELEAESNPMLVSEHGPRVLWADLHGHSAVSDGTGTPEDFFLYARDVAALDVAALTDHDHWGMLFLDQHPELWQRNVDVANSFHEPGRFVALPGYEWTSWVWGHRNVVYFADEAPLYSSVDERYDTPQELSAALARHPALAIPHHPAGGPIAVDWKTPGDLSVEPVVEVVSAHGCSEALDCPRPIYSAVPGHFARDALSMGLSLGLVASGDGHDGHPGFTHLGPHYPTGGLTAILAEDLGREDVLAALRARRAYATSGPRILLRFALGAAPMGSEVPASALQRTDNVFVQAFGTAPIRSLEVIRSGEIALALAGTGETDLAATATLEDLAPGEYVYVRVVQTDDGTAFSSPVFVTE